MTVEELIRELEKLDPTLWVENTRGSLIDVAVTLHEKATDKALAVILRFCDD